MASEGTGDVIMVLDSSVTQYPAAGGEDYIPLTLNGRVRNLRVLQIGGPAAAAYLDRRPEAISSVQDAEGEDEDMDPARDGGEEEEEDRSADQLPVPRLPGRAGPGPFLSSSRPRPRAGPIIPRPEEKLETTTYAGGGEGDCGTSTRTGCAICMEEYEAGDELSVVPCSGKHRFHRECLAAWLARKRLCPLCRHALPLAADETH